MTLTDLLTTYSVTMAEISRRYGIPYRTLQDWAAGKHTAPSYVLNLLARCLEADCK